MRLSFLCLVLVLFFGCSGDNGPGPTVGDTGSSPDLSSDIQTDAQPDVLGDTQADVLGDTQGDAAEVTGDPCETNPCANDGVCAPSDDGTNAVCDCVGTGFMGALCDEDIDECADETDHCSDDATCANTPGSFTCTCADGFEGDGVLCDDIDECEEGTANCIENSSCANTEGGYE